MNTQEFFNVSPRQSVNSTLVGILLMSWMLWMVVYYFHKGTDDIIKMHEDGAEELVIILEGKY